MFVLSILSFLKSKLRVRQASCIVQTGGSPVLAKVSRQSVTKSHIIGGNEHNEAEMEELSGRNIK